MTSGHNSAHIGLWGFGLPIESDQAIPGTSAFPGLEAPLRVNHAAAEDLAPAPLYGREQEALVFTAPGVARYRCTVDSIAVTPQLGGDGGMAEALLIATALPAVQWLRGHVMLHAAGLVLPGCETTIALAGPSGSGKSSIAAALLEQGAALLGDDSLRIACGSNGIEAAGLPGGLFIPVAGTGHRRFITAPPGQSRNTAGLDAILLLGDRDAQPSIRRLGGPAALAGLLAMQHRPRIPQFLGMQGQVLEMLARIARELPVLEWRRREGRVAPDETELDLLRRAAAN